MPFAWTPEALDDLHRLYIRQRLSAAETARAMGGGVTRNAVLGKVQRLGWTRPAVPKAEAKAGPDKPRLKPTTRPKSDPFSGVLPLPKLREITVISTPRPWTERAERECAFPVAEPKAPGQQFSCCATAMRGRAYCPAHWRLMTLGETALSAQDVEVIVAIAQRAA